MCILGCLLKKKKKKSIHRLWADVQAKTQIMISRESKELLSQGKRDQKGAGSGRKGRKV